MLWCNTKYLLTFAEKGGQSSAGHCAQRKQRLASAGRFLFGLPETPHATHSLAWAKTVEARILQHPKADAVRGGELEPGHKQTQRVGFRYRKAWRCPS